MAASFLNQVKLDIKSCAQVYNTLPEIPSAEKFAPLETDASIRANKASRLVEFVSELRKWYPRVQLVIELSVCTPDLANMFPSINPFTQDWMVVQGGLTHNWAASC